MREMRNLGKGNHQKKIRERKRVNAYKPTNQRHAHPLSLSHVHATQKQVSQTHLSGKKGTTMRFPVGIQLKRIRLFSDKIEALTDFCLRRKKRIRRVSEKMTGTEKCIHTHFSLSRTRPRFIELI